MRIAAWLAWTCSIAFISGKFETLSPKYSDVNLGPEQIPPPLLNVKEVEAQCMFSQWEQNSVQMVKRGKKIATADDRVVPFETRIDFTNEIALLSSKYARFDRHFTFISFGSGALFTEGILFEMMNSERYFRNITAFFIDYDYDDIINGDKDRKGLEASILEFQKEHKNIDLKLYTTAFNLLNTFDSDASLVERIRNGSVVMIGVDPPTAFYPLSEMDKANGLIDIHCALLDEERLNEANLIVFSIPDSGQSKEGHINQRKNEMIGSGRFIRSSNVMAITLDRNGRVVIEHGGAFRDPNFVGPFKEQVQSLIDNDTTGTLPYGKLYKAVREMLPQIGNQFGTDAEVFPANTWESSWQQVQAFFDEGVVDAVITGTLIRKDIETNVRLNSSYLSKTAESIESPKIEPQTDATGFLQKLLTTVAALVAGGLSVRTKYEEDTKKASEEDPAELPGEVPTELSEADKTWFEAIKNATEPEELIAAGLTAPRERLLELFGRGKLHTIRAAAEDTKSELQRRPDALADSNVTAENLSALISSVDKALHYKWMNSIRGVAEPQKLLELGLTVPREHLLGNLGREKLGTLRAAAEYEKFQLERVPDGFADTDAIEGLNKLISAVDKAMAGAVDPALVSQWRESIEGVAEPQKLLELGLIVPHDRLLLGFGRERLKTLRAEAGATKSRLQLEPDAVVNSGITMEGLDNLLPAVDRALDVLWTSGIKENAEPRELVELGLTVPRESLLTRLGRRKLESLRVEAEATKSRLQLESGAVTDSSVTMEGLNTLITAVDESLKEELLD